MSQEAEHSRDFLNKLGFGPYEVNFVDNFTLELKDGAKIAINVWFPGDPKNFFPHSEATIKYCQNGDERDSFETTFPCIMEYLPYCKSHWTAERDYLRHPWMSSHGFVIIRVDMRGSGNSSGLYFDEYLKQEADDACEIIDWIAQQPWSNGSVGMFGKSWGGFNGLQVAFCQPKPLKAVISLYSTDNRFTDDCHYKGGCILGTQMLSWASVMFAWNARPPHPKKLVGNSNWIDEWKMRLENAAEPWTKKWLSHQAYDDYWKHGSVCEDYSKIAIPILAIGGWHDMYSNAVFRLVDQVPNCRGIIGPWSHDWPDVAVPGAQIGFLPECLDFWNHHLKGKTSMKQQNAEKLIWYQCLGTVQPGPSVKSWPGEWLATQSWKNNDQMKLFIGNGQKLQDSLDTEEWFRLDYDENAGLTCGEVLSFGAPDLPGEQRFFNLPQHTWSSKSLEKDLDIVGFPSFSCNFKILNDTQGHLAVKFCDIFPDGKSRLISIGAINLNHYKSNQEPEKLTQGKSYSVSFELDAIGYRILKGHQLSISVTPTYWPIVWTPRLATSVEINSGQISIPILVTEPSKPAIPISTEALFGPELKAQTLTEPYYKRTLEYGLSDDEKVIRTIDNSGKKLLVYEDVTLDEDSTVTYSIKGGNQPLTSKAVCHHDLEMEYFASKDDSMKKKIKIETTSEMQADESNFVLTEQLNVSLNDSAFFSKTWKQTIPRNLI